MLTDGIWQLTKPFTKLFQLIYQQKKLPEQLLMAKVIPVHKNSKKDDIMQTLILSVLTQKNFGMHLNIDH